MPRPSAFGGHGQLEYDHPSRTKCRRKKPAEPEYGYNCPRGGGCGSAPRRVGGRGCSPVSTNINGARALHVCPAPAKYGMRFARVAGSRRSDLRRGSSGWGPVGFTRPRALVLDVMGTFSAPTPRFLSMNRSLRLFSRTPGGQARRPAIRAGELWRRCVPDTHTTQNLVPLQLRRRKF